MRFLLDANLPRSAVSLVAELGHEVDFARDRQSRFIQRLKGRLAIVEPDRIRFRPALT